MTAPADARSTRRVWLQVAGATWTAALLTGWVLIDTAIRYTVQTKLTLIYHDGRIGAPPGLSAHELTYVSWVLTDALALACAIVGVLAGLCYLTMPGRRLAALGYALGRRWTRLGLLALVLTALLAGAGAIRYLPLVGVSSAGTWLIGLAWGLVSLAGATWALASIPAIMVRPGRPDIDPIDLELAGQRPPHHRPPELDPDIRGQRWPGTFAQLIEVGGFWRTAGVTIATCVLPVAAAITMLMGPERSGSVDQLPLLARGWVFAIVVAASTLLLSWSGRRLGTLPSRLGVHVPGADDDARPPVPSRAFAAHRPGIEGDSPGPGADAGQGTDAVPVAGLRGWRARVRARPMPAMACTAVVCVLAVTAMLTYSSGVWVQPMPDEQVLSTGNRPASAAELSGSAQHSVQAVGQLADGRMATVSAERTSNGVAVSSELCDPATGACTAGVGASLPQRRLLDGISISTDGTWALVTGQESVTTTGAVEVTSCSVDYCPSPHTQRLQVPDRTTSADSDNWDLRAQVASWPGGFTVVGWFTDYGGAAPAGPDTRTSPAYLWQCPDGECSRVLDFTVPANADLAVSASPYPAVVAVPAVANGQPYSAEICRDLACSTSATVSIPAAGGDGQVALTGFGLTPDSRPVLTTHLAAGGADWLTVCLTSDCRHHASTKIGGHDPMPTDMPRVSVGGDGTIATATMTSQGDLTLQTFDPATGTRRAQAVVAHFGEVSASGGASSANRAEASGSGNPWDFAIDCLGPDRVLVSWTGWYGDSAHRAHSAIAIVQLDLGLAG